MMTRSTNARIAGFTYLFYIAVAFPDMLLEGRATGGQGISDKLASIAQHANDLRLAVILTLLSCMSALVLAVTLCALTRDQDRSVALLGFACRVTEGITGAVSIPTTLGLLWLATTTGANAPDPATGKALAAFLLHRDPLVGATFFAFGSTAFCWLLLRGRMIPLWLAWVGFLGSAALVVVLPLQLAGFARGAVTQFVWLPIAVFEITVGVWWLIKGDTTRPRA